MANIIALIIFSGSFIGLVLLVFKKVSFLADLPEQIVSEEPNPLRGPIKQNILQKTSQITQAVLHNKGVGAMGVIMTKTTGRFKAIFISHMPAVGDLEKVEKIHQEGDYWQKVETYNFPSKKKISKQPKIEIVQVSAVEVKEAEPQPKKIRIRKKKAE